eukprot:GHVU01098141.1.p1 GENE.GHVU01098141.1~~GHVU01098141.1.p1  ORF type:complete len:172 (-),score=29.02 GHVU01098141.1:379-894(-)
MDGELGGGIYFNEVAESIGPGMWVVESDQSDIQCRQFRFHFRCWRPQCRYAGHVAFENIPDMCSVIGSERLQLPEYCIEAPEHHLHLCALQNLFCTVLPSAGIALHPYWSRNNPHRPDIPEEEEKEKDRDEQEEKEVDKEDEEEEAIHSTGRNRLPAAPASFLFTVPWPIG